MNIVGTGKRVRVYIGEQDRAAGHHEPLWQTILELLRAEGAAGATMVRGMAGFGAHSKLHLARLADISPDLPVVVEWIDGPERIERLLPRLCQLVDSGTITLEDVEIVKYPHRAPRPMPSDTVEAIMTRSVISVQPETPIGEVVRLLLDRDFRCVPVVDDQNRLVGIITGGDLVERGGLRGRVELLKALGGAALERELATSGAREHTAADVMTQDVVAIAPEEPLKRAAHVMVERRIKRLPVVDHAGRLAGMLSRVDVLRTMGEDYPAPTASEVSPTSGDRPPRTVGDLMRTDVPSVGAAASVGEVLDAVTSTRLNRAIVVDASRRVLGIVSDADLLARLDPAAETGLMAALMGRGRLSSETKISARELISGPVVAVPADTPVGDAAQRMLEARHKVLPITNAEGYLLGVVDRADLLGAIPDRPTHS